MLRYSPSLGLSDRPAPEHCRYSPIDFSAPIERLFTERQIGRPWPRIQRPYPPAPYFSRL